MFWKIIRLFNKFVPKSNLILFYSIPDFSDNPYYLYKKMKECGLCNQYKCIWIVNTREGKSRVESYGGVAVLRKNKLNLIRYLFRARYFISSHGPPLWRARNQISIELYHGIPLKKLLKQFGDSIDVFITPSPFVSILFSANLQASLNKFLSLGQPRCDVLFSERKIAVEKLGELFDKDLREYSKIIMYLPTFRDYDDEATKKILFDLLINEDFKKFLLENNALFIMKPHPRDENYFEKLGSDNIVILKNSDLLNRFLTLYDTLPAVDVLVTDYSSVYFDYLLLNRPVVFYVPDLEKYRETRGFLLEPYESWTPGDKARNVDELIKSLQEAIDNPSKWEKERLWLRDVMFKYQDGKASERIIKYFWGDT